MKILLVVNNIYSKGNGLSSSVRRMRERLILRGHEVRVLSGSDPSGLETPDYPLKDWRLPVFDPLVRKQGYVFAKADKDMTSRAVEWADVVHLEEPFGLQSAVADISAGMGVSCVGTYHLHPENLLASVHLDRFAPLNLLILRIWRNDVYDKCVIVTCPTDRAAQRLRTQGFKADIRVVSNGMLEGVAGIERSEAPRGDGFFDVLSIGRLSVEKSQATLLEAMRYCDHGRRIRLHFAGRGPLERSLKRRADRLLEKGVLSHPASFGFYPFEDLVELCASADLYVHCATIEVEGMSCMEAIQTGIVPIIADAPLSATSQFALSAESVYPARDPRALARRIDYWLGNDDLRRTEARRYAGMGREYAIEKSVDLMERVYSDAISAS